MHCNEYGLDSVFLTHRIFYVFQIHSDFDDGTGNIYYSLEGKGANQAPFRVFVVNPESGAISVTKVLDREEMDTYNVSDSWQILFYFAVLFNFNFLFPETAAFMLGNCLLYITCQMPFMFVNVFSKTDNEANNNEVFILDCFSC